MDSECQSEVAIGEDEDEQNRNIRYLNEMSLNHKSDLYEYELKGLLQQCALHGFAYTETVWKLQLVYSF